MATSSFDKRIEVNDAESVEKLVQIMTSTEQAKPINASLFSPAERLRSEELLARCLSHSKD